jgi:DNA-binding LacI/PurR family transcriptional regulator
MIDESAKVVAVSTSSILQVLKNFITIKAQIVKRVFDVVKKINYDPDIIARSSSKEETYPTGVIVEDVVILF